MHSVTATVTDNNDGLTSSVTFLVEVTDDEKPVFTGQGNTMAFVNTGLCYATVTWDESGSDNCGRTLSTQPSGAVSGGTYPVGTTGITVTATDPSDNTKALVFVITVVDDEPPAISSPTSTDTISSSAEAGMCVATVSYSAATSDNCPGETTTYSIAPGSSFNVGTQPVTATVTDNNDGLKSSVTFLVEVTDDEKPVFTGQGNTMASVNTGLCYATVTWDES